jgi:hypothetical protein
LEVVMGIAPPVAVARPDAKGFRVPAVRVTRAGCLLICGYLAAAVLLNWRLLAGLQTMTPLGDPGPADNDQFAWFMRYTAEAVAHGQLPALVTQALNAPRGINLMWNTSFLLPSLVLAPITLLGGPQASLTLMLTFGYAGSAAAMYWLLRRQGASLLAGGLGGALYGFSPAVLDSAVSHYNLQFAVLPPLIIEAVLRILGGKGRPLAVGAWLGALVAAQVFIEEEVLVHVVIACLLLAVVLVARQPRAALLRLRAAAASLGTAAVVTLAICGYGLWIQFHGPLTEHGSPYPNSKIVNSLGVFVNPQPGLLFHTASSAAYAVGHGLIGSEYLAYLGWPLLVLLALIIIRYWRDLRVRAAGVIWAVLELLSLGGGSPLLPFHWLQGLPLLVEMLPDRLSILADAAAAAVLAFGLDLARTPTPQTAASPSTPPETETPRAVASQAVASQAVASQAVASQNMASQNMASRAAAPRSAAPRPAVGWIRRAAPVTVAVLALLPLIPRPVAAVPAVVVPAGWSTVFARLHLPATASVLVVPVPYSHQSAAMRWQAETGIPGELVAGWFIGPAPGGRAVTEFYGPRYTTKAVICLDGLWNGSIRASRCSMVPAALAYWHPAAIVAETTPSTPLGLFLTKLLRHPPTTDGQLLAWRT